MDELSVVIPIYNEEKIIVPNLKKIEKYLQKGGGHYEIIAVNDGSNDGTLKQIQSLEHDHFKIVSYKKNQGKGYAVQQGVLAAKYENILFLDADLATPIEELEKFIPHAAQYDILIGSRSLDESKILNPQSFFRRTCGKIGKTMIKHLLVKNIHDTQCGFKLFKQKCAKDLFNKQKIKRWGFDFEIIFLAQKFHYSVKEVPILWYAGAESKLKTRDYFRTLFELIKLHIDFALGRYSK